MGKNFILSITKVITLCVIIFAVSAFFVYDTKIIGWVIFALGLLCLGTLKLFKIIITAVSFFLLSASIAGALLSPRDTYNILEGADLGQVIIRVDKDLNPHIISFDPLPSLHPQGGVASAAAVIGISYSELLEEIVRIAITRYKNEE